MPVCRTGKPLLYREVGRERFTGKIFATAEEAEEYATFRDESLS